MSVEPFIIEEEKKRKKNIDKPRPQLDIPPPPQEPEKPEPPKKENIYVEF